MGSVLLLLLILFCISLSPFSQNITFAFAQIDSNQTLASTNSTSCPCVVFRIDDIQDAFVNSAQLEAMNLFISRGQPLSLGIVMKDIGDDLRIVGKVGQGSQMGLFELGLHGWEHVDYTALSEAEQKSTLNQANEKLKIFLFHPLDILITRRSVLLNSWGLRYSAHQYILKKDLMIKKAYLTRLNLISPGLIQN